MTPFLRIESALAKDGLLRLRQQLLCADGSDGSRERYGGQCRQDSISFHNLSNGQVMVKKYSTRQSMKRRVIFFIGVDAAVAQEGPPAAHILAMLKIDVEQAQCLLAVRPLPEEFALRPSHKTGSPKLDATRAGLSLRLAYGRRLEAHPVDSDDRKSVGHSMAAHHGGPRRALALLFLLHVGGFIADGRRVDQNLCPPARPSGALPQDTTGPSRPTRPSGPHSCRWGGNRGRHGVK